MTLFPLAPQVWILPMPFYPTILKSPLGIILVHRFAIILLGSRFKSNTKVKTDSFFFLVFSSEVFISVLKISCVLNLFEEWGHSPTGHQSVPFFHKLLVLKYLISQNPCWYEIENVLSWQCNTAYYYYHQENNKASHHRSPPPK